jgi:lysozyme family protein
VCQDEAFGFQAACEHGHWSDFWYGGKVMNKWDASIAFVLEMEGGYTLDPNDPGGETKYGISKKAYPNLDIKNLTIDQAKDIYHRDYWNECRCDHLPFPFAVAVFDMAVNQGTGKAIKTLQHTLGVTVDGIMGSMTLDAARNAEPRKLKLFLAHRLEAYEKLMAANQALLVFALNWSFRVLALAEMIFVNRDEVA